MSQITPLQILRDHMSLEPGGEDRLPGQAALAALSVLVALVAAGLVIHFHVRSTGLGALLTATSIMTGLSFSMALRFWEKSIDARSDPNIIFDDERRNVLDTMRTLLLWTVLSGVVSSAWLAGVVLVAGSDPATTWASAVGAGAVSYQLTYVLRSLVALYSAAYTLRP
jgi:hypothetical protein